MSKFNNSKIHYNFFDEDNTSKSKELIQFVELPEII